MHLNFERIFRGPIVWLVAIAWMVSHGWFLIADPDISMATGSRGAWTDEGTLLSQVRNYVNGHAFESMSSDGFMKAPLFSFMGSVVFEAFGCGHLQARMMVLSIVSLTFLFLLTRKPLRLAFTIFILTTGSLLAIHQHSHFALTEMVSVAFILIAAYRFYLFSCRPDWKRLFWVQVWIVLATLVKIQFVYLLPLPLLCSMIIRNRKAIKDSLIFLGVTLAAALLVFWIFIDYWKVFHEAQSGSWTLNGSSFQQMLFNGSNYFFRLRMLPFTLLGLSAIGYLIWDRKPLTHPIFSLVIFGGVWTMLECHKLTMDYLPIRYMVSFYAAIGLMMAAYLAIIFESQQRMMIRMALYFIVFCVISTNMFVLVQALQNRRGEMGQVRNYLKATIRSADVVAGTWGPSLTWDLRNKVFPVWEGFTKPTVFTEAEAPTVLISEHDFNESGGFFQRHFAFEPVSPFDSVRTFKVLDWSLQVCWLSNQNQP